MPTDLPRVVVTGMGVVAANGVGVPAFERALRAGQSGIRHFKKLEDLGFTCQVGGVPEVPEELKRETFSDDLLIAMNSSMVYAGLAGVECWKSAGFAVPPASSDADWDTSAIIGTGIGGIDTLGDMVVPRVNEGKVRRLGSTAVEQTMASGVSARVGGILGLGGQVTTNSSACTTGTEAIVNGFNLLRSGRGKRVIAGGVEGSSHFIWAGFDAMRVLAKNSNATPETASRPLSATATGFVPSSGAGLLMLETLESAHERGATILAEIVGAHVNSGGHRSGGSMTAQSPEGVVRCVRAALQTNNINPNDIDLINGHLTATGADAQEVRNWTKALERDAERFPLIQSTKSMIGHALGAAGGIEAVGCVLQISNGFIHPSINCEDFNPAIPGYAARVPRSALNEAPRIIAKASFGFGDVNGCLVFRKWSG